jgi:hypothetical protein
VIGPKKMGKIRKAVMSQPRFEEAPPEYISKARIRLHNLAMEIGIRSVVDDKEKTKQ